MFLETKSSNYLLEVKEHHMSLIDEITLSYEEFQQSLIVEGDNVTPYNNKTITIVVNLNSTETKSSSNLHALQTEGKIEPIKKPKVNSFDNWDGDSRKFRDTFY